MDEIVEEIQQSNQTNAEYYAKAIRPTIVLLACLIGFIADALIMFIVAKYKRMRSRTNIIILNFAIFDALVLLTKPSLGWMLLNFVNNGPIDHTLICIMLDLDVVFKLACFIFIRIIMSNTLIKTKKVSNMVLLTCTYSVVLIPFLINTSLCIFYPNINLIYLFLFLVYLSLLLTIIVKEINICCRKCKNNPVSSKTKFRLTFARIYIYTWFVIAVAAEVNHLPKPYAIFIILQFIYFLGLIPSLYLLMYLAYADKYFKICLLNIFRSKDSKYHVDATIRFAKDSSDSEQETKRANINLNHVTNQENTPKNF